MLDIVLPIKPLLYLLALSSIIADNRSQDAIIGSLKNSIGMVWTMAICMGKPNGASALNKEKDF